MSDWTSDIPTKSGIHWFYEPINFSTPIRVYVDTKETEVVAILPNVKKDCAEYVYEPIKKFMKKFPGTLWCEITPPPLPAKAKKINTLLDIVSLNKRID